VRWRVGIDGFRPLRADAIAVASESMHVISLQRIEISAAVITVALAYFVAEPLAPVLDRLLAWTRRLAYRPRLAMLAIGVGVFAGCAAIGTLQPPIPRIHDEFSYLLGSDTFAAGRLTNPTPPLWQHFETLHELMVPTYASKYPPMQAIFLAAGQALTGRPIVGAWLSAVLACVLLLWALRAWVAPVPALVTTILVALRFGIYGYWSQSFWGGFVAFIGGCLLFGGIRRLYGPASAPPGKATDVSTAAVAAVAIGLGLVLLANSRPYEGLLASICAAVVLFAWLFSRPAAHAGPHLAGDWPPPALARAIVAGVVIAILALAAGSMLHYNRMITGSRWTMPYQAYERQYAIAPPYLFARPYAIPVYRHPAMARQYFDWLVNRYDAQHTFPGLAFWEAQKTREVWGFYWGAWLSFPVLLLVWIERRRWLCTGQVGCWLILPLLGSIPASSPAVHTVLAAIASVAIPLSVAISITALARGRWQQIALATVGVMTAAIYTEVFGFAHYAAPVGILVFVLLAAVLERIARWRSHGPASVGGHAGLLVVAALVIMSAALLALRIAGRPLHLRLERDVVDSNIYGVADWADRRQALLTQLRAQSEPQLVIVHYSARHDPGQEWVYNRADLAHAKVIWARDMGASENLKLMAAFPGREVHWLAPDSGEWRLLARGRP
jgi:hypothetical protein